MFARACSVGLVAIAIAACSTSSAAPPAGAPLVDAGTDAGGPSDPAGDGPIPDRVTTVAAGLQPLLDCSGRIWNGYDLATRQVLLVGIASKTAYLWNDQSLSTRGTVHTVDFASIPSSVQSSFFYSPIDFRGPNTLAISLDDTAVLNKFEGPYAYVDLAIGMTIHEGFHLWGQAAWAVQTPGAVPGVEASDRDPDYPDVWQLRYLRSQVEISAQAALDTGAPLGNVAHWQNELKAQYGDAITKVRYTDITEGTAQYVTTVASIVGKLGCSATDDAVVKEIDAHADAFILYKTKPLAAGQESYDLGQVALLLLRKNGAANVETTIAGGTAPIDMLLAGVTEIAVADDPATQTSVQTTVETDNAAAKEWIEPLIARLHDVAAARLVLPSAWTVGAFTVGDSYYDTEDPADPDVSNGITMSLTDPKSSVKIKLTGVAILDDQTTTPCGTTDMMIVPLAAGTLTLASDQKSVSSTSSSVNVASLPVNVVTDAAGLAWLCPVL